MSSVNQTGCFNFTWKIENFNIYLSTKGNAGLLCSPVFKTESNEGSDLWKLSLGIFSDFSSVIMLERYKEWQTLDGCEISLIGTTREVSLDCQIIGKAIWCGIEAKMILSEDSLISEDSLSICCKIRLRFQEPEDRIIRTILHEDCLSWNIEKILNSQQTFIEKDNLFLDITLTNKRNTNAKLFTVLVLPSKDICTLVHCHLDFITDGQGSVDSILCDWPYVKWETEITCKENASRYVELKLDYIVGVHVFVDSPVTSINTFPSPRSSSTLGEDLLLLYREKLLTDATLTTEGKSLSAHRGILAARSPVFRAMFKKDEMSEARSGVVDIDDLDSETVDRMLVFLYGDSLEGVQWEEASTLYYAADKYAVRPLKEKCADILKAGLLVNNACDALVLADKHSDEQLMKWVVDFLRDHEEVISSARWEELEESHPRLTSKVTREILLRKSKQNRKMGK